MYVNTLTIMYFMASMTFYIAKEITEKLILGASITNS